MATTAMNVFVLSIFLLLLLFSNKNFILVHFRQWVGIRKVDEDNPQRLVAFPGTPFQVLGGEVNLCKNP
jgi:hypothetical protein